MYTLEELQGLDYGYEKVAGEEQGYEKIASLEELEYVDYDQLTPEQTIKVAFDLGVNYAVMEKEAGGKVRFMQNALGKLKNMRAKPIQKMLPGTKAVEAFKRGRGPRGHVGTINMHNTSGRSYNRDIIPTAGGSARDFTKEVGNGKKKWSTGKKVLVGAGATAGLGGAAYGLNVRKPGGRSLWEKITGGGE